MAKWVDISAIKRVSFGDQKSGHSSEILERNFSKYEKNMVDNLGTDICCHASFGNDVLHVFLLLIKGEVEGL